MFTKLFVYTQSRIQSKIKKGIDDEVNHILYISKNIYTIFSSTFAL